MFSGISTRLWLLGLVLAASYSPVHSNVIITLTEVPPAYEDGIFGISAPAPIIAGTPTTITNITFAINGTQVSELTDLSIDPVVLNMAVANLIIRNIPASLNNTIVSCTAELSNGDMATCTPRTLQVQGTLNEVRNLNSAYSSTIRTLTISWTAPPAIPIPPATEPEIFYCVEINNGTATESIGCNRTRDMNEETSVMISDVVCGVNVSVTITPFNRVGDGQNSMVLFPVAPTIMERGTPVLDSDSGNLNYTYAVSGLVCTCMATILDASLIGELLCEADATAGQITITTNNVTPNRDFSIRIVASNSREYAEKTDEISTSDVSDLNATSSVASQLVLSVTFVQETRAQGVFISVQFRENGLTNFNNSLFFIMNRATAAATNQLTPLPMGNYLAQAYDLEADGEISIGQPADQEMVMVTGPADPGTPMLMSLGPTINCSSNLTADGSAVTVMCSYDSTMYSGYSVCILNQMAMSPKCIPSTESGSMVIVNGTINGEHEVFVNPTFISSPPMGMLESPHRETYTLAGITETLPTTDVMTEPSSTSTQDMQPSSPDTRSNSPPQTGRPSTSGLPPGAIIGVVIGIVVIIIVVILIVLVLVFLLKSKNKKSVVVSKEEAPFIMNEKDGKRSLSMDNELIPPVYESAVVHAKKPEPVPEPSANGDSQPVVYAELNTSVKKPPADRPPSPKDAAPKPVTDVYATVDKKKPQEQTYETVQLKSPKVDVVPVDEHRVEYATLQYLNGPPPKTEEPPPPPVPPHTEETGPIYVRDQDCYEILGGMASEWKTFAAHLVNDEEVIEEIDCNNSSDFACLHDFLNLLVMHRSKAEIAEALEKMGLKKEAEAILQLPSISK